MLSLPSRLENFRQQSLHTMATLWKIERLDNVSFFFTSREEPIEFEGDTYQPAGSMNVSATQLQDSLRSRNLEARGIINADDVTDEDLRAGLFRDAEVTEYLVNARFPYLGAFYTYRYRLREVTFDGMAWTAEVQDIGAFLRLKVGNIYARNCRHRLGDALCQVNLASFTESSKAVTTIDNVRKSFRASALASTVDDYFRYGRVVWLTGNNAGVVSDIKDYVGATRRITLQLATPFNIQIGDTFNAIAGCDLTFDGDCKTKFSNGVNFGGFPTIPGNEKALETPNAI